ncbi:EAL domain-containing protein [Bengtsoniella intestinalis]|uniref:EAL domain-containing protein n=1 Tax=Bengtsoniella intestinalis TaxID=3073143 RepID=UPI00391F8F43
MFEKNGFIQTLDYYVLSHTCKFLQTYQHLAVPRLSVNLSGVTMLQEDVVERVMEILNQYQVVPAQIDLEITETAFVANSAIQASLKALQHMGFTISIDDFGTGVSSLSRLRYMDLDTLKIDREFIIDALDDKRGNSILNHVIEIAKDLDLETVAEGIETADQLNYLREIGCDVGQGFYYARPMPEAVFVVSCEKLTQEGKC